MKYFISDITLTGNGDLLPAATDILKTFLADAGYEAFEDETESAVANSAIHLKDYRREHPYAPFYCFSAYIQQSLYDEENLNATIASLPFEDVLIYNCTREAEDKNWNETWEQSQEQSDICRELGITIDVKQAFGTGQHNTTRMIVEELKGNGIKSCRGVSHTPNPLFSGVCDTPLQGKTVLDCGCGSGILAIAALTQGAERAVGYDIDEWSVNNSLHNAELNGIKTLTTLETLKTLKTLKTPKTLTVLLGDASVLETIDEQFDIVLANINRNILLNDMPTFVRKMKPGATLILSGFYTEDAAMLTKKAATLGLAKVKEKESDGWCCLVLQRSDT